MISQCHKTLIALALALGAAGLVQTWRLHSAQLLLAETQAEHASEQAAQERLAREASETNRQLEQRHREEIDAIDQKAQSELARSQAAVQRARDARERLQRELAGYLDRQRGAASDPGTARQCTANPVAALDLLAELFRGADERAGALAAAADEARLRGLACEAAYDTVANREERHDSP